MADGSSGGDVAKDLLSRLQSVEAEVEALKTKLALANQSIAHLNSLLVDSSTTAAPPAITNSGEFTVKYNGVVPKGLTWTVCPPSHYDASYQYCQMFTAVELLACLCQSKAEECTFVYPVIVKEGEMNLYNSISSFAFDKAPTSVLAVGLKSDDEIWTCYAEIQENSQYEGLCSNGFDLSKLEMKKMAARTFTHAIQSVLKVGGTFSVTTEKREVEFKTRFKNESEEWVDDVITPSRFLDNSAETGVLCTHQMIEYMKLASPNNMPSGFVQAISSMYNDYIDLFHTGNNQFLTDTVKQHYLKLWFDELCYRVLFFCMTEGSIVLVPGSYELNNVHGGIRMLLSRWIDHLMKEREAIWKEAIGSAGQVEDAMKSEDAMESEEHVFDSQTGTIGKPKTK